MRLCSRVAAHTNAQYLYEGMYMVGHPGQDIVGVRRDCSANEPRTPMHGRDSSDDRISTMRFGISTVVRPYWFVCGTNTMHPYNIMTWLSSHTLTLAASNCENCSICLFITGKYRRLRPAGTKKAKSTVRRKKGVVISNAHFCSPRPFTRKRLLFFVPAGLNKRIIP